MPREKKEQREGSLRVTIITILILILLTVLAVFFAGRFKDYLARRKVEEFTTTSLSDEIAGRPENPVDFPALWAENEEIYAWISVPNTDIELPIVQSMVDDLYYLERDIYGKKSRLGSIFTQSHNTLDFSDPVTVMYGHNYHSGGMFTNLHRFEDKAFFDSNENFYIYLPGRRLTYLIVSAFKYDERHIMNAFDFADPEVLEGFHKTVKNPPYSLKNVRESAELTLDDRLVVLSTCMTNGVTGRYLVIGVLLNDERTK